MPERKKLELELNKPCKIELMSDQCLKGTSRYGDYYLYNVRNGTGEELSYFADKEVHEKLKILKRGDKVELCKKAEQKRKAKLSLVMKWRSWKTVQQSLRTIKTLSPIITSTLCLLLTRMLFRFRKNSARWSTQRRSVSACLSPERK